MPLLNLVRSAQSATPEAPSATRVPPRTDTLDARIMEKLLELAGRPALAFRLWTGETVGAPRATAVATFGIADRRALLRLVLDPSMQFGELFAAARITLIEGDLVAALREIFSRRSATVNSSTLMGRLARQLAQTRRNTLLGAKRNIHDHYDIGNDFYRLWLDPTLSYTCAYFTDENATLLDAQIAKLDHVCRKLRLQPDQTVIEAGSGWGSLALHAASRYGVRVRAFNISHEQIVMARRRARRAGLTDRVEFIEDDYRNASGACDAFVSVGMLEHVGPEHYAELGAVITRTLRADGHGLLHTIGRNAPQPVNRWIEQRIFPGSYTPSLAELMAVLEPAGLSVLDVENLRPHYARTLSLWLQAFNAEQAAVHRMFGPDFVRMWQLYLAGSQAAFESGEMQLFQVAFAPATNHRTPWTREHLYHPDARTRQWTAATS